MSSNLTGTRLTTTDLVSTTLNGLQITDTSNR